MWKAYDPRVLDQIMKFDYRDLEDGRVELVTPPIQTFQFFGRPSPPLKGYPEGEDYADRREDSNYPPGFYQDMRSHAKQALSGLHCRLLILWETKNSLISDEGYRKRVMEAVLSRSSRKEKVEEVFVEGRHSLALFAPKKTAKASARWIAKFWEEWTAEEGRRSQEDAPIDAEKMPDKMEEKLKASLHTSLSGLGSKL